MDNVMPKRDGLRIWKILKKIQLKSDHGIEKLGSDHGVEKLKSDYALKVEIGPCRQKIEFSAIELSFLP